MPLPQVAWSSFSVELAVRREIRIQILQYQAASLPTLKLTLLVVVVVRK